MHALSTNYVFFWYVRTVYIATKTIEWLEMVAEFWLIFLWLLVITIAGVLRASHSNTAGQLEYKDFDLK